MDTDEYYGLENLLEVVVEEEDQELNVANQDNFELPPVPTFDLQSTQFNSFTYLPTPSTVSAKTPPLIQPKKPAPVVTPKVVKPVALTNLKEVKQQLLSSFESTRMVLDKADKYPKDLTIQSADEMSFYHTVFKDLSNVTVCRLHCTICDKHIGCGVASFPKARAHRMLKVLICKECFDFYGDGKFPLDDSDNTEVYCRWCGQGGDLVCCSFCPKVFCNKCVKRNFDTLFLKQIEKADEWACFCCAQIPLWPLRAVCRALLSYLQCGAKEDITNCCKKALPAMKPKRPIVPKSATEKQVSNPMVVFQPGVVFPASSSQNNVGLRQPSTYKFYRPPVPQKPTTIASPPARLPGPVRPPQAAPRPHMLQKPAQETPKSRAGRPIRTTASANTPKPSPTPASSTKPVLPLNMPKVRIDHSTLDTTVVRLRLSNNKEQYLRVNVVGGCQRMPKFPPNPSITMTTLAHAFRANKMAHDKLKGLKDKLEGNKMGNIFEEATAIKSMLSKWQEIVNIIENDLAENIKLEEEKLKKKNVDVIELSDDDEEVARPVWKFLSSNSFVGDSDVEIIDDPSPTLPVIEKRKSSDEGANSSKKIRLSNGDFGTAHNDDSSIDDASEDKEERSGVKLVDDDAETETDEEMDKEEKTESSSRPFAEKEDSERVSKQDDSVAEVSSSMSDAGERGNSVTEVGEGGSSAPDTGENDESAGDKTVKEKGEENGSTSDAVADDSKSAYEEDTSSVPDPKEETLDTVNEKDDTNTEVKKIESEKVNTEEGQSSENDKESKIAQKSSEDVLQDNSEVESVKHETMEVESESFSKVSEPVESAEVHENSKMDVEAEGEKSEVSSVVREETPDVSLEDNDEMSKDIREEELEEEEASEEALKGFDTSGNDENEEILERSGGTNEEDSAVPEVNAQPMGESDEFLERARSLENIAEEVSETNEVEKESLNKDAKESVVSDENFDDVLDDLCAEGKSEDIEKMEVDDDLEASLCTEDLSKDALEEDIDEEALLNDG